MGLGDTISNILLQFKGDTRDLRKELKKLDKAQKASAKAQIADIDARNSALDNQIAFLGKLTLGFGAVVGAVHSARVASDRFAAHSRLTFAAGQADLEGMQRASRGLIKEMDLLQIAAALQNGSFEVSNEQMRIATKAMIALRNQGNDFAEVQREVTRALVEGNTEGLKKFGVLAKGASDTQEGFNAAMRAFNDLAQTAEANMDMVGDSALRMRTSADQLWDSIVVGAGNAVEAVANLVFTVAGLEDELDRAQASAQRNAMMVARRLAAQDAAAEHRRRSRASARAFVGSPEFQNFVGDVGGALMPLVKAVGKDLDTLGQRILKIVDGKTKFKVEELITDRFDARNVVLPPQPTSAIGRAQSGETGIGLGTPGVLGSADVRFSQFEAIGQLKADRQGSFQRFLATARKDADALEKTAQAVGNLNENMAIATSTANAFASASTQAIQAWLDGSKSLGKAIKEAFAETLRGLGFEMAARALFHGAMALGSLAFGRTEAAATHGIAAAKFAGGATAALGMSALLGGFSGGGATGTQPLPSGARGQTRGISDGGMNQTFLVMNSPFDDDPRAARQRMQRSFRRGQQERGPGTAIIAA